MAEKTEFLQAIDDAILDADSLEQFINGTEDETVLTRLSAEYPTLQKALKELFENGGIAGRFKTLAELEASPLLDGAYALVADDAEDKNGIYIKEGEAWVKSKYNMQEAVTKALSTALAYTDSKLLDVLDYSINLVDPKKALEGIVISSEGEFVSDTSYFVSDFIRVEPRQIYSIARESLTTPDVRPFVHISFYDMNKKFIKRELMPNAKGVGKYHTTITMPSDVYYVRLSTNSGDFTRFKKMFYVGSEEVEYVPYEKPTLNKDILKDILKLIEDTSTSSDLISEVLHPSLNLVNPDTSISNYVILADGTVKEGDSPTYTTSDYIRVESGETYTGYRNSLQTANVYPYFYVAYYDPNKNFMYRGGFPKEGVEKLGALYSTLVIPGGVGYVRLMTNAGSITQYDRMFYKGADEKPYQPYSKPVLTGVTLGSDISEKIVSLSPISPYLIKSKNLFDYNDTQKGFAVQSDGQVQAAADYTVSGFINVEPQGVYTMQSTKDGTDAFINTAFYDKDKNFIRRDNTWTRSSADGSLTITMPSNANFVRFNINQGSANSKDRMFHKGSGLVDYEEFGTTLTGLRIDGVGSENASYQYDMQIPSLYQTNKVWSDYKADHYKKPNGNVYAKFDALQQAHPDYITKQVLGDDDWGNTISCYHFKPNRLPIPSASKVKNPKVFIICGTHGYEHMPPLVTYLMMKELAENWDSDPALELLRHNVDFLIIPVANPSGWDDYTRKNRNGVDINRSFPPDFGWQSTGPNSSYYGGAEPLQEKESQYINQVLLENKDIDICLDFHNFHGEAGRDYYIWFSTANPEIERVGQLLSNKMTRAWRKDFEWLPSDYTWNVGKVTSVYGAMIQDQASALGVPLTSTLEICERWWLNPNAVTYDEIHCKTGVETLVNALLLMLDNLRLKQ